jgi:hypothetical protein
MFFFSFFQANAGASTVFFRIPSNSSFINHPTNQKILDTQDGRKTNRKEETKW